MDHFLGVMQKLKKSHSLGEEASTKIENAYYLCKPPENAGPVQIVVPPLERFVRHLLWHVLDDSRFGFVLRSLERLPWMSDPSVETTVRNTMLKVTPGRFSRIPLVCTLVQKLARRWPALPITLVDETLFLFESSIVEYRHDPLGRTRSKSRLPQGEPPDVCDMEAIDVFFRINRVDYGILIDVAWQGELHKNAVDLGIFI